MRTAEQWLAEYQLTHQNPQNKLIHRICVPIIYWSAFALLWWLPVPAFLVSVPYLNWATVAQILVLAFYFTLGFTIFIDMLFFAALTLIVVLIVEKTGFPLGPLAIGLFIAAWIGQFYGHQVEGKKPAFFQDLAFLLIGPLWLVNDLKKKH
jgi:uncharacterized membrane protein YGL010W